MRVSTAVASSKSRSQPIQCVLPVETRRDVHRVITSGSETDHYCKPNTNSTPVQGAPDVLRRGDHHTSSCPATSGHNSSPPGSSSVPQLGDQQKSQERRRGQGTHDAARTMARPSSVSPTPQENLHPEIHINEVVLSEPLNCTDRIKDNANAKANDDPSELGRGKRKKKPANNGDGSLPTKIPVDLGSNKGRSIPMGKEKVGYCASPHVQTKPAV